MKPGTTREGADPELEEMAKNGDLFQAPSRHDNVSPFEPEGSHGGLPLLGGFDGQPRHDNIVPPFLQPRRGDREEPGVKRGDQRRAQSKSRQGRKKIAPGFNPGSMQPQRSRVP